MSIQTVYRHSQTNPVRGREVDVNFDTYATFINAVMGGTGVFTLSVYANNAAALAGGLIAGNLYRTGGNPDLVSVVH